MNFEQELTLALVVISSWMEDDRRYPGTDKKIIRAWSGYQYEVLESLERQGLIKMGRNHRSLEITTKGKMLGEKILQQLKNV